MATPGLPLPKLLPKWVDVQTALMLLFLLLVLLLLLVDVLRTRKPKNFPPGPFAFPFVGNVFQMDPKDPHVHFCKLAEKYGDIFSLRLGASNIVILNGFKAFKEAMIHQTDIFSGLLSEPISQEIGKGYGIFSSTGQVWKEQRKFAVTTLRNFGVGKKSLEGKILQEIKYLNGVFEDEKGQPFDPHYKINVAVTNIISSIVFGERYEYSDSKFQDLLRLLEKSGESFGHSWTQLYSFFPTILKYLPGPHKTLFALWDNILQFIKEEIQKHKANWNPEDPRDFIDCYLAEMEKGLPKIGFTDENLIYSTLDLFVGGSETTTTTLRWILLYMAGYPDIQEKVHAEIDSVIGQSRAPTMEDRPNLPYTDAVIHEVQRRMNIAPLTVPRLTTKDTIVSGYFIPKDTKFIVNLHSVLLDKTMWETPEKFNPEHFLDSDGKRVNNGAFVAFSGGKRNCMGEPLARMELLLFVTSLLQKFRFQAPDGVEISYQSILGVTVTPMPYKICAIPH
eukprot:gi/632970848/ref/XP_007901875.1/ PREDICTED: cytochrome P450 2J2 isoform X1 [Callorhinchus milii]